MLRQAHSMRLALRALILVGCCLLTVQSLTLNGLRAFSNWSIPLRWVLAHVPLGVEAEIYQPQEPIRDDSDAAECPAPEDPADGGHMDAPAPAVGEETANVDPTPHVGGTTTTVTPSSPPGPGWRRRRFPLMLPRRSERPQVVAGLSG